MTTPADNPRPLLFDGATGTMLASQRQGRYCDELSLSHPDAVAALYLSYLRSGADIITTNTFNSNSVSFGATAATRLCAAGAAVARRSIDTWCAEEDVAQPRPRVAGCLGPTAMAASKSDAAGRRALEQAFAEASLALMEGGVEMLLVESVYDGESGRIAVAAACETMARRGFDLPLTVSLTVDPRTTHLFNGEEPLAFYAAIADARPVALGFNCTAVDAAVLRRCASQCGCGILYSPSAGLPDANGVYGCTPDAFADVMAPLMRDGTLAMAGGCCGTTPEHIAALRRLRDSL